MEQEGSDSTDSPKSQSPSDRLRELAAASRQIEEAELLNLEVTLEDALGPARAPTGHGELVRLPQEEPRNPDELDERRRSDVNEWGRSEHMREIARRVYDPIYKRWFRVEWEGLEKIPSGGALLVANHAAAIPSEAPVIMHGIETELNRPVYGLADNFFRTIGQWLTR